MAKCAGFTDMALIAKFFNVLCFGGHRRKSGMRDAVYLGYTITWLAKGLNTVVKAWGWTCARVQPTL